MEGKARLVGITRNYKTQRLRLTFEFEQDINVDDLNDKDLRVRAVRWKNKRSLDANAYAWLLMGEIAKKLETSAEEIYEWILREVFIPDEDDQGPIMIHMRSDIDIDRLGDHWKLIYIEDGYGAYVKLKGSSEYDTAEMSRLIDFIVSEARSLGIDTDTPDEIERIKTLWPRKKAA